MISAADRQPFASNTPEPMQAQFHSPSLFIGPTHQEIATCAYLIWEHEGRPEGREKIHWDQARAQLIACREHDMWLAAWRSLMVHNYQRQKKKKSRQRTLAGC
jgi:hypothetical protein